MRRVTDWGAARLFGTLFLLIFFPSCGYPELTIRDVGRFDFEGGGNDDPSRVAEELSGITRLEGDHYIAISDQHACLHRLTIDVDSQTGEIKAATFGDPLPLLDSAGGPLTDDPNGDREGVVYDPATGTVWITNEQTGGDRSTPSICQHSFETGRLMRRVLTDQPGLEVFAKARVNRGFESLTRRADGNEIWTANEEALVVDGPEPSTESGTVVRLQKLDGQFRPVAQYAYVTQPLLAEIRVPEQFAGYAVSGVSDLLVLPDGRLLALERMFAGDDNGFAENRIGVYEVDYRNATDVSKPPFETGLEDRNYTPVKKKLLIELEFPLSNSNFEGITLGPKLANGEHSLVLIADNQSGTHQALYALRLSGLD